MTLDELFTEQNQRLFDMLFRHQVYLEGYKTALSNGYREYLRQLYGEFAIYLRQTRYQRIDQFTKLQLTDFIRRFNIAQGKFYSKFTDDLIAALQAFLAADAEIHKRIMQAVMGKDIATANASREYSGIYGIAATDDLDRLWANITNSPIPANGALLVDMFTSFGDQTQVRIQQLVRKAYANADTSQQLEQNMLGTGEMFTGGLLGMLLSLATSMIGTAVQHVSSEAQAAIASIYSERYQWVAILDSKTTPICRSRDGIVYVYGEGPLPPAHYTCRSKAVPISSEDVLHDIPESYFDWLKTQPAWFLVDVLGDERAHQLLAGDLASGSFTQISTTKPLTLSEFQGKVKYILGE